MPSGELDTERAYVATLYARLDALREKVYLQISKKFGRKGTAIGSPNMAVIEDGLTAVIPVPYDEPAYLTIDAESAPVNSRGLALSSAM